MPTYSAIAETDFSQKKNNIITPVKFPYFEMISQNDF